MFEGRGPSISLVGTTDWLRIHARRTASHFASRPLCSRAFRCFALSHCISFSLTYGVTGHDTISLRGFVLNFSHLGRLDPVLPQPYVALQSMLACCLSFVFKKFYTFMQQCSWYRKALQAPVLTSA
eukprot:6214643-Pleurochrysis_carterae.AAC.2